MSRKPERVSNGVFVVTALPDYREYSGKARLDTPEKRAKLYRILGRKMPKQLLYQLRAKAVPGD